MAPTPQDTSELFTVLQTELNELKVKDPNAYAMLVGSLAGSAATLASIAGTNRAWAAKVQQWNSYVSGLDIHNETQSRIYKAYGILALTMVNIGMSTYAFVESVESWSDLRPDQKVASVASAFQTLMSVREGFNLIKYIRNPDLNIGNAIRIGDVDFLALNDDPAYAIQQTQTLAERGCATVVRDTLKAFLEPVNAIIAVIGVINIVTVGFQIAEDVDDGQPVAVIVMDAVTELTLAVAVATTPFVAACPAIGVVVAIAGIIEAIVGIFIPRNPPPIVQWTQDTASTFVAAIPDPSAGWLSQYHIAVPTALLATDLAADLTVAPVDAGDGNLVAQIIWQAIEGIRSLPDLSANLEALVQNAPGVGPVFFRTPGNGTVVNGTDHTKSITEVGAWTMGYLIAGNSNFSVVNQAAAAQSLSGFFTGSAAIAFSEDVFLEWLYETRGFAAVAQYQKTAAGKEIVEKILAPLFIPLSWAQEEDHLLPLQILMLLATNWGADLTEVRQRYATAGLPETVFAYADHTYNFFSSLAANNDYISTISASQTLQHGSPGSNCGVDSCNLCSPTTCQWGGGPYNWSYVRLFHGDAVWNWVVGNPSLVPVTGERPFTIVRISIGPDKAPPAGRRYPPPCPC